MAMTDEELRAWVKLGQDANNQEPIIGPGAVTEVETLWGVVAEIGRRVLDGSQP